MDYSQIRYAFGMLNRRSQAYITDACRPWHIGYSEYVVLEELYRGDGCSQDELSKALSVDKGLVARCVKSLEEKGYVQRRQDERDKRFKYIYLTEKARHVQEQLMRLSEIWIRALTRDMNEDLIAATIQGMTQAAGNAASLTWNKNDGEMGDDL